MSVLEQCIPEPRSCHSNQCQSHHSSTGALWGQLPRAREEGKWPRSSSSGSRTTELPQIYTYETESVIWPNINLAEGCLGSQIGIFVILRQPLWKKSYDVEKMRAFLQNFVSQTTIENAIVEIYSRSQLNALYSFHILAAKIIFFLNYYMLREYFSAKENMFIFSFQNLQVQLYCILQ